VQKKDGLPAYQICSISDDLEFQISHVVQGEDLKNSTYAQMQIAEVLDLKAFRQMYFLHHPVLKYNGEKLSKSQSTAAAKTYLVSGRKQTNFIK
jgi:glutamyl-tRNA synthetase